ncbi:UDP-4-amino-4,6-dideoxy-N-acetyl-beta-L-altrosamine transaminase [Ammoniphilus sp. CFH 90114]|uniref:UDP-4-amino-4, 6-dideoxy-N-acetyl-beta-L-altrosamine transaminase n=1 Tax=Ammoniphilus sp. CFH 90114 TaxID=2493665 RepID=UPI00100F1850|nr:UDP-4-amino-4,6-dideoxy-N-acetyl-beta-L-altrosamine transaminase [Ammoniphilus sp. CFH 90114]RXT04457.1 UDP-4-amino-4,6-dideoxy-N-acetyl-beta-L-altrosamine transaminase [Ammoniphilus sp. CFH 90114]
MDKLALFGGRPVRETFLPYGSQWVDEEDIEAVTKILRSPFLTQGPEIDKFEQAIADISGARYAVAFSNGTAALHGACFAAGIEPGDEVITSPLTFVASSNCVLYQGGTPIFADVDERTYLLDIAKVRERITPRTKALIPVDFAGQPVDMRAYKNLSKEYNLVYIQDAAHSLGASFSGDPVGAVADMTMFSFHPVKPVTTAEGGVIVTNSEEFYEKLRLFRSHGITRDASKLEMEAEGPWYYEMQSLGYNYRMTDLQAVLGSSQLAKLEQFIERRREIAKRYDEAFVELEELGLLRRPYQHLYSKSGWHLYVIQLGLDRLTADRRTVFEALRAENIGVNVHYIPIYRQPYYQRLGYPLGTCPKTDAVYERMITLPLFPKMSKQDICDVILAVKKVVGYFSESN